MSIIRKIALVLGGVAEFIVVQVVLQVVVLVAAAFIAAAVLIDPETWGRAGKVRFKIIMAFLERGLR